MNRSNPHITAFLSAVICAMYLCATVGFDIHADHHDNRIYVASLIKGDIGCESIHPEDECNCRVCHEQGHERGTCLEHPGDCTDDVEILSFTGTGSSHHPSGMSPAAITIRIHHNDELAEFTATHIQASNRKHGPPPEPRLSLFCILRV